MNEPTLQLTPRSSSSNSHTFFFRLRRRQDYQRNSKNENHTRAAHIQTATYSGFLVTAGSVTECYVWIISCRVFPAFRSCLLMATLSVTHWQLLLQEGDTRSKTKTSLLNSDVKVFFKAKGRNMSPKAKRLLICQSRVLEAERAFSSLQTLGCKVEKKKKIQGPQPGWNRQFVLWTTQLGRMGNDTGIVFSFKKSRKFEKRELEGM